MGRRRLGIVGVGLAAIVLALVLQWPELVGIGLAFVVLPLAIGRIRNPGTITWHDVSVPARVTRGDQIAALIGVESDGSTPLTTVSAVDSRTGARAWLDGEESTITWPIDTGTRGVSLVGPDKLEISDPFGLTLRVLATREQPRVMIVPRLVDVDVAMALRSGSSSAWQGLRTIEVPQAGARGIEEFHSLREYLPGDSKRLIHWKATARLGTPVIRNMTDSDTPRLVVVLDVNPASYGRRSDLFPEFAADAFEEAVDLAASWAWWGCEVVQELALVTTAPGSAPLIVRPQERERALDHLALAKPDPDAASAPDIVHTLADTLDAATVIAVTGPTSVLGPLSRAGRGGQALVHAAVPA